MIFILDQIGQFYRGPTIHISSFWTSFFIKQDFSISANQKQESSMMAIFGNGSGPNEEILYRTSN